MLFQERGCTAIHNALVAKLRLSFPATTVLCWVILQQRNWGAGGETAFLSPTQQRKNRTRCRKPRNRATPPKKGHRANYRCRSAFGWQVPRCSPGRTQQGNKVFYLHLERTKPFPPGLPTRSHGAACRLCPLQGAWAEQRLLHAWPQAPTRCP